MLWRFWCCWLSLHYWEPSSIALPRVKSQVSLIISSNNSSRVILFLLNNDWMNDEWMTFLFPQVRLSPDGSNLNFSPQIICFLHICRLALYPEASVAGLLIRAVGPRHCRACIGIVAAGGAECHGAHGFVCPKFTNPDWGPDKSGWSGSTSLAVWAVGSHASSTRESADCLEPWCQEDLWEVEGEEYEHGKEQKEKSQNWSET